MLGFKARGKPIKALRCECKHCILQLVLKMLFYILLIALGLGAPAFLFSCVYLFAQ